MDNIIIDNAYTDEIWLPISNIMIPNIKNRYYVSNYGRVYNSHSKIFMKQQISNSGYYTVIVQLLGGITKRVGVHRVELFAFNPIDNHRDYYVNHKDGNKLNNSLSNLEWVDYSGNLIHAYESGLKKRGEEHCNSIYKEEQIRCICKGLQLGKPYELIAKKAGLPIERKSICLISDIKNKISWKFISDEYSFTEKRSNRLFTDDQIHEICKLLKEKYNYEEIIQIMNLDPSINYYNVFNSIKWKRRYTNISNLYF